jgi:hypothetical protein
MCSTLMFGTLKLGLIDLQSAPHGRVLIKKILPIVIFFKFSHKNYLSGSGSGFTTISVSGSGSGFNEQGSETTFHENFEMLSKIFRIMIMTPMTLTRKIKQYNLAPMYNL